MGVYIKGMEMPTSCDECWIPCAVEFQDRNHLSRPKCCPCFEVKVPHGRLIDADALLKSISRAIEDDSNIADVYEEDYELVNDWLASAPTIIEAEEE